MRYARRTWGWYFVLLDRKHFKVKLLKFKRKGRLSIQYHKLRNETWLFLSGKHSGEYWYIPQGDVHTYYAENEAPLVLEIQYGELCDESDIVRIT